ncbi:MAG TPA: putative Ig domain-containing protein [Acidimicrobiales bacterium]|nr:putative Ig domain-containing protein [Acidimicrobiales bacterium]
MATASLPAATVTVPYAATLTATGGETPYTWSATGLPAWASLDPSTGVITGTPTTQGTSTVAFTVAGSTGQHATRTLALEVRPPPLTLTSTSLPPGVITVPYTAALTAIGGESPYTWSATGLPAWASLDPSTGTITGTPTATGTSTVTVTVTDYESPPASASAALGLSIAPPLAITTATLPAGSATLPYTATLLATGGETPYTWSATGLPAWASIDPSTGVITGTPTAPMTATVTVTVTDTESPPVSRSTSLSLVVLPTPLSVTTTGLPEAAVGAPFSTTLAAIGGTRPYTWSATGLPSWASLDPSTGVITGTPTASAVAQVEVTVKDSASPTASAMKTLTFTIEPVLALTTTSLPPAATTVPYSAALVATGGITPYRWSASGLPDGLDLSAAGTVTGTPVVAGTSTVTVVVSGATGEEVTRTFVLDVELTPLQVTTSALPDAVVGAGYEVTLTAVGGSQPYTWSATGLSHGLVLSRTGTITGTPETAGTATVVLTVTDAESPVVSATVDLNLSVQPVMAVATTDLADATAGSPYAATLAAIGGIAPYTWSASGLPSGLTLSPTGAIRGTPVAAGTTAITVEVRDAEDPAAAASAALTLVVGAAMVSPPPSGESPECSGSATGSPASVGGYWLAAADGALYSCGDAAFDGSLASLGVKPSKPVVGITAAPTGRGYWEVAADGGVFAFGPGAPFHGTTACLEPAPPTVAIVPMPGTGAGGGTACGYTSGQAPGGYRLAASDGGVFSFGNAPFDGSLAGDSVTDIVGVAEA